MSKPEHLLIGDVHGSLTCMLAAMREASDAGVKSLIQLGDFGFIGFGRYADDCDTLDQLQEELHDKGMTLRFLLGNHEHFPRISATPWGLTSKWPNIIYMESGSSHTMTGTTVGVLGGAVSVDRKWRQDGRNLFIKEEKTKLKDARRLPKCGVLLSHDSAYLPPGFVGMRGIPDELQPELYDNRYATKMGLEISGATKHFHGHLHISYKQEYCIEGVDVLTYGLNRNQDEGWLAVVDADFNVLAVI